MSFYEPQGWQAPVRQASWEQPPPPSRSGASSTSQREDGNAFAIQFEEVDRATDNLLKSGKFYTPGPRPMSMSVPGGRPGGDFGPRVYGGRHTDFDPSRPHTGANLQNFYASQRHQGRQPDPDQIALAKRRMAAQRERELRNYHQEQQYNRSVLAEMSSSKSDRSMSPSALSEEGRRELIARQHRALYGAENSAFVGQIPFTADDATSRDQGATVPTSSAGAARGPSPRGVDPFGISGQVQQSEGTAQGAPGQDGSRVEKAASPSAQASSGFGNFDPSMQSSGKAPTPPSGEESSHSRQISKSTMAPGTGGMGPIGSRPNAQQAPNQSLNKRTTSPLPSSLGYGFGSNEQNADRANSANSTSNATKESSANSGTGAWGTGSGVWGSNKIGATSVWG
ncbi:hypothetical protein A1O3_07941 [Capronia epimyces CBS 606.96]|uniref:Uncharacterized protein n=1 Tax=Capronia epimyces CBS 606.96 TaxID=1182542 RepID=W9XRN9_9EURO|nr:uncharacterized protein A1O3_07941 [Capronia epimyces CBS 606.96]EXJ79661.1 hypothetical protein A1O3_07941 [Capronia epimyces CBS 606.96]